MDYILASPPKKMNRVYYLMKNLHHNSILNRMKGLKNKNKYNIVSKRKFTTYSPKPPNNNNDMIYCLAAFCVGLLMASKSTFKRSD